MSEQDGRQAVVQQRPTTNDRQAWKDYWKAQAQPWRTEPEIGTKRQKYLAEHYAITPNVEQGIYPLKDVKLSRADVEWLLATYGNEGKQLDWSDKSHSLWQGLDVRGADLRDVNLIDLPLNGLRAGLTGDEWYEEIANKMYRSVGVAHLEGADLRHAHLQDANLGRVHLEDANLQHAHLERAYLAGAHLEGAVLREAHLEGAYLRRAFFSTATDFVRPFLGNEQLGAVRVVDANWDGVNLTLANWSQINMLGDEHRARQKKTLDGMNKDHTSRLKDHEKAVRANRQLAIVLQTQGLNEEAARFAYRAQVMQRKVFWYQGKFGHYLFSMFLAFLSGYGYKPVRSFITYAVIISIFAFIYFLVAPHLAWNEAIVISMTAFHGRGFFPEQFKPGDPQALVAAIEAFVGLLIEVTLIATLTHRLFGK